MLRFHTGRLALRTKKKWINGTLVDKVFSNLHCGLRYIRASISSPQNLWFDAICINQKYWPERREQLLLMGELYANARKTIVWLGGPNPHSDTMLSHFSSLGDVTLRSLMARYDKDKEKWLDFGDG